MFLEPFEGPQLKIERAKRHFFELKATIDEFQVASKPAFVKTDRAVNAWELQTSQPIPRVLSVIIGDIAHSLRSALDVTLNDIAAVRGVGMSDMAFPFAESEEAFQKKLAASNRDQPFKKLGADVVAMIEAAQPYKGGNLLLRGLHDLNNQDKHRMTIPIVTFASTTADLGPYLTKKTGKPVNFVGQILVGLEVGAIIDDDKFFDHPSEAYKLNPETMVLIFPKSFVFGGSHILPRMADLVNLVAKLVESFRAQVIRR